MSADEDALMLARNLTFGDNDNDCIGKKTDALRHPFFSSTTWAILG
jgi:hypothetical protein